MADEVYKINLTDKDAATGNLPVAPRLRMNRSTAITLTTSWQRVDFNGTSAQNANTYPMSSDGINKMVYYDTTNKIIKFMSPVDRNYSVSLYLRTTSTSLLNTVNLSQQTLQLRFIVPAGADNGIDDYYFPFPGEDGMVDLCLVNSVSPWRQSYINNIYADARKRGKGVGIELRLSSAPLGTVQLTSANILLYGK